MRMADNGTNFLLCSNDQFEYLQDKLGDVVYVDMPEVDSEFSTGG